MSAPRTCSTTPASEPPWAWTSVQSGRRDSNPRRQPWQGCTLPLSYSRVAGGFSSGRAGASQASLAAGLVLGEHGGDAGRVLGVFGDREDDPGFHAVAAVVELDEGCGF